MFNDESAFKTPTSVTFGKSRPLAIICVPRRIWASPRRNAESMSSCEWRRDVESASMRSTLADGKHFRRAASARCVPSPWNVSERRPHTGHFSGTSAHDPQMWHRRHRSALWYVYGIEQFGHITAFPQHSHVTERE